MPIFVLATLLTIIAPIVVAAIVFYVALPWWIDRTLRSDPRAHDRLCLDVSEKHIAWTLSSARPTLQRLPYAPLAYAVLGAMMAIAIEAAAFASSSQVPQLWYVAGGIAAATTIVLTAVGAWLLRGLLRRMVDRALERHANDRFFFAAQSISDIWRIVWQIDRLYALIGLRARINPLERGRQALLEHARLGRDAALAAVIAVKAEAEHDLRSLDHLAHLFTGAQTLLEQAKAEFSGVAALYRVIVQIEQQVRSRDLADALEDGRWPDARSMLEKISSDLRQFSDFGRPDAAVPESLQDAYSVLKVHDVTPMRNIKAVVTAFQRVWHPDFARDELERQQHTLRMQQINVAWDIIQKARPE